MSSAPTGECLEYILDALDAIACRAISSVYYEEVAAEKWLLKQVQARTALILLLIGTNEPQPGLRLVKK